MKTKLISAALLLSAVLFSCKNNNSKTYDDALVSTLKSSSGNVNTQDSKLSLSEKNTDGEKIPVGNGKAPSLDTTAEPVPLKPTINTDWDKKIIKTATLKLEVKNFKSYNETVHKTVKQFGGYIAQEENNFSDQKSENTISIKVPVDQFEDMVNQLPGADVKVMERKITTDDVTGEIVDTRSRLEAKKQMRLKYLEFLKQSKNMEEVLQVQSQINSIQEEIESASGRVESLSHQAVYSTINLTFYEPLPGFNPNNDTPSFLSRVSSAFKSGGNWFAELFVALMSIWPLLLAIIAGIILLKRSRLLKTVHSNTQVK